MLLYHFTHPNVWPHDIVDPSRGLRPGNMCSPLLPPVVWLTRDPNPGGDTGFCCYVRLTVDVPRGDSSLKQAMPWFRQRLDGPIDARVRDWRMYHGSIPGMWIVGAAVIKDRHPWWAV